MLSETALGIYYWGVYVWFVVGVVAIAIPAIVEIKNLLAKK